MPTDPQNYRPIAFTCTMCKIMETIIKDQLIDYLLLEKLISKTTNLLECSTHIAREACELPGLFAQFA